MSRKFNSSVEYPPLECTDLDPKKSLVFSFDDKSNIGIRVCDLCPSFPFDKLTSVMIDNVDAHETYHDLTQAQCVFKCLDEIKSCVALSYDTQLSKCYTFNNTVNATFLRVNDFLTVLITQPTGLLGSFTYTRNTRVYPANGSKARNSTIVSTLNQCLAFAHDHVHIAAVSYDFRLKSCQLFSWDDDFNVEFEYKSLAAFHLNFINHIKNRLNFYRWRFGRIPINFYQRYLFCFNCFVDYHSLLKIKFYKTVDVSLSVNRFFL